MTSRPRPRSFGRRLLGVGLALLALAGPASFGAGPIETSHAASAALPRWTGAVDLYRDGAFTTQHTWQWCTAADVQIMRNIVRGTADHSRAGQRRYFDYMRDHNRYAIPAADGVDPVGWTAGLRRYVDDRYRLTTSRSFDAALRSAVTSLRRTGLPVAITVARGSHAWVLTGFSATADPAATTRFRVTSVRVTGSLWGLQSRSYGYDMAPNTRLTPRQLAGFFTPWHYAGVRMAWEGRWVSVQPRGGLAAAPSPASPTTAPTIPTVVPVTPSQSPSPSPSPTPSGPSARPPGPSQAPSPDPDAAPAPAADRAAPATAIVVPGLLLAAAIAVIAITRVVRRRR